MRTLWKVVPFFLFACATSPDLSKLNPRLRDLVTEFKIFEQRHPGAIPWSVSMPGNAGARLTLVCAIHGDEIGCLPGVMKVLRELEFSTKKFSGTVTVVIGNPRALEHGKRFIEQDLNRVFTKDAPASVEHGRALEVMSVIENSDLVIDFHQTIQPSKHPFYTFAYNAMPVAWARILGGATVLVTRKPDAAFAKGAVSTNEFAMSRGVTSVAIELGQLGFSTDAEVRTYQMIEKAMDVLAKYDTKEHAAIKKLATSYPQLRILVTALKEPFANAKMFLTPGFENFSYVKKGEVLAFDGDKKIKAPFSGFMLFPKYPKRDDSGNATGPLPTDIFNLAREATSKDLQ